MLVMESNQNTPENSQNNRKIKNILGHPVKRVICDKQGNIILDVGDLISFRALEQVKQANELDYLFGSVYRK